MFEQAFNNIAAILRNEGGCTAELDYTEQSDARGYLESRAKGSIMAGLNMSLIEQLPLRLPSIHEQREIVETTKMLRAETLGLESIYRRKLAALDELKKSLLHQAFNGDL